MPRAGSTELSYKKEGNSDFTIFCPLLIQERASKLAQPSLSVLEMCKQNTDVGAHIQSVRPRKAPQTEAPHKDRRARGRPLLIQ